MRRAGPALGVVVLLLSALYGGNVLGLRDRVTGTQAPAPEAPALGRSATEATPAPGSAPSPTRVRSFPWWQTVQTAAGDGTAPDRVATRIGERALQWRVRWTCERGTLEVTRADDPDPIVSGDCDGDTGPGYATATGDVALQVVADGPWELQVDQQVDVPLVEPPLPEMQDPGAEVVARGTFYDIDQTGRGEVVVYRLPDGQYALRLEDFFVSPNVDLEVRLSPLPAPRTTQEYQSADAALVQVLEPTTGSMNLRVPEGVDPTAYASVVIWCPPVLSAYAAASLEFEP